jgi:hypothetical protein
MTEGDMPTTEQDATLAENMLDARVHASDMEEDMEEDMVEGRRCSAELLSRRRTAPS